MINRRTRAFKIKIKIDTECVSLKQARNLTRNKKQSIMYYEYKVTPKCFSSKCSKYPRGVGNLYCQRALVLQRSLPWVSKLKLLHSLLKEIYLLGPAAPQISIDRG